MRKYDSSLTSFELFKINPGKNQNEGGTKLKIWNGIQFLSDITEQRENTIKYSMCDQPLIIQIKHIGMYVIKKQFIFNFRGQSHTHTHTHTHTYTPLHSLGLNILHIPSYCSVCIPDEVDARQQKICIRVP